MVIGLERLTPGAAEYVLGTARRLGNFVVCYCHAELETACTAPSAFGRTAGYLSVRPSPAIDLISEEVKALE